MTHTPHKHNHAAGSACTHQHDHEHKNEHEHEHKHEHAAQADACCAPATLAVNSKQPPANAVSSRFHIAAMDCPTEEALIRKQLSSDSNILRLDFDLLNRILTVHQRTPDTDGVSAALVSLGMQPQLLEAGVQPTPVSAIDSKLRWRVAIGGLLAFGSEAIAWWQQADQTLAVAAMALSSILICGLPTLKKGWIALRHFTLNIHLLMTAAVIGAFAIGQWPEAAMVICLFAVAEMIEAASLERARDAISGLLAQAPETALVQQPDASWLSTPTAEIAVGALLLCRPGDRIALDGVVEQGQSSVNQAAITGESMPVTKQAGDTVFAGTINQSAALQIRVTANAGSSMLARIAQSVQDAQSQRAPTQGFVDRFAAVYTPVVFIAAILLAVLPPLLLQHGWHDSLYRALVLLVIACPCALVISTPVTVVSGLAAAARRGIVIKGGVFLEQGRQLRHLALDKTGTLTEGKPQLQQIRSDGISEAAALQIAASLDAHSSHPLAQALLQACELPVLEAQQVSLLEIGRARGMQGIVDGRSYQLGNQALLQELNIAPSPLTAQISTLEQQGNTVILLCREGQLLALFAVADQLRATSQAAIQQLQQLGVQVLMLTGDNAHTANAIAAQAGIQQVRAELLPDDKLRIIEELAQQGVTGMTGDGINDAPALARAHIGLAMAAGSDTALETADVALMQNDLQKIPEFIRLSQQTARILKQNIAFALGVKFIFFALALSGHASLWMAVFADTGTSLLVVLNGLRLLKAKLN